MLERAGTADERFEHGVGVDPKDHHEEGYLAAWSYNLENVL